jgi:hypothetical protein
MKKVKKINDLKVGKRYYWYSINEIIRRRIVSGLLDSIKGDRAILKTRNGDVWEVPINNIFKNGVLK